MYVLIAILIFGLLILIHEFGHYLTARLFHVEIHEFAIGMGPRLFSHRSRKTGIRYSLRLLPFGGFVSMPGELGAGEETPRFGFESIPPEPKDANASDGDDGYTVANKGNTLSSRPPHQRLIVHVAGATMNILLGIVLLFALCISLSVGGQHSSLGTTTVSGFRTQGGETASTEASGLRIGDRIVSVAGQRVFISDQLLYQIMRYGYTGKPTEVEVVRADGSRETLQVLFPIEQAEGQTFGTIDFTVMPEEKTVGAVLKHVVFKAAYIVEMIWESIFDLITGRYSIDAVAGPIGTAGAISSAARSGLTSLLYLTVVITINLGVFNLFPLPPLDGGHVIYTLYELIFRRPVPERVATALDSGFSLLLFGFLIFITFKDIIGLF